MQNKTHLRLLQCGILSCSLILATTSHAQTTLVSSNVYSVDSGVAFTLGNSGASSFLFNWTDPTGATPASFSNIADPTLVLTLGQTYTFQRITTAHPFVIMNNTAAAFMSGTDGTYSRTTTSSVDITNATLTPIADFTAIPGTPGNTISWTPSQVGDFWYTCSVASHPDMAGKITVTSVVVPQPKISSSQSGANVILSWPANAVGYNLQQNVTLNPSNWTNHVGTVITSGANKTVTLTTPSGRMFYRLSNP